MQSEIGRRLFPVAIQRNFRDHFAMVMNACSSRVTLIARDFGGADRPESWLWIHTLMPASGLGFMVNAGGP
jgi:hypothetical protein